MIVAKFGGTAITPRNLKYVKSIVANGCGAVVVSAIGREFKEDTKATDLLLNYFDSGDETFWQAFADKYRRLATANAIDTDAEALLADAHSRALRFDRAYCASLGEELAARLAAKFLGATYVEAADTVRFDGDGALLRDETYSRLKAAFCSGKRTVMGGFYGGCANGRSTFSRGGGDVSGAIVAAATEAALYENWTDVSGVCVADPVKVHNVATVDGLSYRQMRLLSRAGAEVLHPDAVAPCEERGIPIRIGNFFDPDGASTLVSNCPSFARLLSLAEKKANGIVVTTALHSYPLWQATEIVSRFLRSQTSELHFGENFCPVDPEISVRFEDHIILFYSKRPILSDVYRFLSKC